MGEKAVTLSSSYRKPILINMVKVVQYRSIGYSNGIMVNRLMRRVSYKAPVILSEAVIKKAERQEKDFCAKYGRPRPRPDFTEVMGFYPVTWPKDMPDMLTSS